MTEKEYPPEHHETEHRTSAPPTEEYPDPTMGRRTPFRGASWGSIIAGALVAVVVMAVLNILGIAIGAATIEIGTEQAGLGVGAGIWWTVSALIGLFCGGWVAGRLSHSMDRAEGVLHGIITWALFAFASIFMVTTTVGQAIGGAFGMVGQQISAIMMQLPDLTALEGTLVELGVTPEAVAATQAELIIAGEQAADALAAGATWAFISLLLGALICALGSLIGAAMPPTGGEERMERARRVLRPRTV